MTPAAFDPAPLVISVLLLLAAGAYAWYAAMLSRVFARLGAERWRAWVPVLNEVELLRLGGMPGWAVVFYVLPVVQLYGLYVRVLATARINALFDRGTGSTALALLVPPVWATVLASAPPGTDPTLQERIAPSMAAGSGYAFAVSSPQSPDQAAQQPRQTGIPPLVPPPTQPDLTNPTPTQPTAEHPARAWIVPPPGLLAPPPIVPASATAPAPAPTEQQSPREHASAQNGPAQPWVVLDPPPGSPSPLTEPPPGERDADLDSTVVVDRRPLAAWELAVDGGPTFRLTASSVVLGRRPVGAGAGQQEIAVPDPTRTLSKVHARLDLIEGVWTVTDLDATNGVIVIGPDGSENLLDPGASATLSGRFVLGKVAMRLALCDDAATRGTP